MYHIDLRTKVSFFTTFNPFRTNTSRNFLLGSIDVKMKIHIQNCKFASYLSIGAYISFFKKTSTLNILTTKTGTTKTCYSQLPTANHNESQTTHYHMEKAHNHPLPHKNNNHTMTDNHQPPPRKILQSRLLPIKVPLLPITTYWHQESPITTHY